MVKMDNCYKKVPQVLFHKMCNKKRKDGNGDLCISITSPSTATTHNHHIKKESFINFIKVHYLKEFLNEYGLTKNEFLMFVGAKKI